MFFEDKDLNAKEPDIQFTKMPKSIYRAMDFIKSADRARFVSACGSKILVSTTHGRRAFDVIMSKLLDYLIRGMSWNGELTLDDLIIMVMTNGSLVVVIIPPPVKPENATGAERVSDLHSLWDCMETYYTVQGKLPLYFDQLEKDLKGAKENEVTQHWFYDYLRFHLALFSSTARSNFMCRLHQCYKGFQLALINKYWKVFATWPRAIPKWRSTPFRGTVLRPVYHYPWRNESGLSDDEKWKRDTRQDIIADLFEFVRHSCQHLHEHVTITDLDEIELFGSSTFDSALVYLIRSLLKANLMEDLDRRSGAWSNFKASKSDLRGPPAGSS
ncbi:hypothetical protein QOZ80_5AG0362940 [Eleusine coracana subsp. coracana]|nr:hypothetical protein QOZ80_5AG0362940 [Eleusine coracana subsp. coracana]